MTHSYWRLRSNNNRHKPKSLCAIVLCRKQRVSNPLWCRWIKILVCYCFPCRHRPACQKDGHCWAVPGLRYTIATTTSARATTSRWWTIWTASITARRPRFRRPQGRPAGSSTAPRAASLAVRPSSTTSAGRRRPSDPGAADPTRGCRCPTTTSNKR